MSGTGETSGGAPSTCRYGEAVARVVAYLLGGAVIVASGVIAGLPWVLAAICAGDGFVVCGSGPSWRSFLPLAAIPFAVLAMVLARRAPRAGDAWVARLVLNAFGVLVLLAVPVLSGP